MFGLRERAKKLGAPDYSTSLCNPAINLKITGTLIFMNIRPVTRALPMTINGVLASEDANTRMVEIYNNVWKAVAYQSFG